MQFQTNGNNNNGNDVVYGMNINPFGETTYMNGTQGAAVHNGNNTDLLVLKKNNSMGGGSSA